MKNLGPRVRVRTAKPLRGYKVLVVFENESQRVIDLEPYLHGPIFEPIRKNASMFRAMKKHFRHNPDDIILELKSRDGHLTGSHNAALQHLIH